MEPATLLSPLRYPGSKLALLDYFETFLRQRLLVGADLYEPYAGGSSIALGLLSRGLVSKIFLLERDPLLYAFWRSVKDQPEDLCGKIQSVEVSLETWRSFQKFRAYDALNHFSVIDLGLAAVFFNRTNFSGVIGAGPIGGLSQSSDYPIGCRFNKKTIVERIRAIAKFNRKINVGFGDAVAFMRRRERGIASSHALVYVDPPYFKQGRKLYRFHYGLDDHRSLAHFLDRASFTWIVSYDNRREIREMFSRQKIAPIFLNYVVNRSRRADELMISNVPLPVPLYVDSNGNPVEQEAAAAF